MGIETCVSLVIPYCPFLPFVFVDVVGTLDVPVFFSPIDALSILAMLNKTCLVLNLAAKVESYKILFKSSFIKGLMFCTVLSETSLIWVASC